MRDRLVKLLCAVACKGDDRREGGCGFRRNDRCNRIEKLDMCMIECIADHLLSGGVIVPPCEVGDTVFVTDIFVGRIAECEVISITGYAGCENTAIEYKSPKDDIVSYECVDTEIGKTVFLTREEAEKALAEGEGKG